MKKVQGPKSKVQSLALLLLLGLAGTISLPPQASATVNEVTAANRYTGNGSTTAFTYGFKILLNTDIEVLVDGVVKTLTTDYTVSGLGASGGGTVTFVTAPASSKAVTLLRKQKVEQQSDYIANETFAATAERIEKDLDKTVMQVQMLKEQLDRATKLEKKSTRTNITLPDQAAACDDGYLKWNAARTDLECKTLTGTGTIAVPVSPNDGGTGAANTTGYTKAGLPAAGTAGRLARVTNDVRGLWLDQGSQWFPISGGIVNVMEFGAKCDGVTNDATALQAAIDALTNGGTVLIPANADCYYTTGITLKVGGTVLAGLGGARITGAPAIVAGSILRYGGSGAAISIAPTAANQRGMGVRGIALISSGATGDGIAIGKVSGGSQFATHSFVQDVLIRSFNAVGKAGINVQNVGTKINRVFSELNYYGISDVGAQRSTTTSVTEFHSAGDTKNGIYLEQTQNFSCRDCIIESVGEEAIKTFAIGVDKVGPVLIDNLWTETTNQTGGTYAALFTGSGSNFTSDVTIRGGRWDTATTKAISLDFVNKVLLDSVGFFGTNDNITISANAVRVMVIEQELAGIGGVAGTTTELIRLQRSTSGVLTMNNELDIVGVFSVEGNSKNTLFTATNPYGARNVGSGVTANGVEWNSTITVGVGQGFFIGGDTNPDVVQFKVSGVTVTLVTTLEGLVEASSTPTSNRYGIYVSGGTIRVKHNFTGNRNFAITWNGRTN